MFKLTITIILLLLLVSGFNSSAQFRVYSDTVNAYIGEKANVLIHLEGIDSDSDSLIFISKFEISNPTLFFPETILYESGLSGEIKLTRENDSIFHITGNFQISEKKENYLINLYGETLAGSDTICTLTFYQTILNNTSLPDFSSLLYISSNGIPMPYIRIAKLNTPYPNPVPSGGIGVFSYTIDRISDISIDLTDILGNRIETYSIREVEKGYNNFQFRASESLPAGEYWLILHTNSGTSFAKFMITK